MSNHIGEMAALATAFCWTITSLSFQQATRKVGSLSVNILRLSIALLIFATISFFRSGSFIPFDASAHAWTWLSASGFVGFVAGDYFLFKSYQYVSARISMLIMAVSPLFAALISFVLLQESMSFLEISSMLITLSGIFLVVISRTPKDPQNDKKSTLKFTYPVKGLLYALGGALGQAGGLVLSKYGMGDYDAFSSTQIRVIAGFIGFTIIILSTGKWKRVSLAIQDRKAMKFILIGSFFGPFLGVFLSLYSIKYTSVGIGSTIMAIVPVLIIPPAILIYKEKVTFKEIIGAILAVLGVSLYF